MIESSGNRGRFFSAIPVSGRGKLGCLALFALACSGFAASAAFADGPTPDARQPAPQIRALADSKVSQQNGAFTSQIAIAVPAFHGITPELALTYNSSAGNGFAGVGWDLQGFSVIERASPGRGSPRFTQAAQNDIYLLDGEELVASTTLGGSYATRRQSFLRISGNGAYGSAWTVTRRDGTVMTYSPELNVGTNTFRWGLTKVQDTHGNTVTYSWACDSSYECYPDRVSYAGTQITLVKELRPTGDIESFATGYNLGKRNYRLKMIAMTVDGNVVRAYALNYWPTSVRTGRSLLKTVQQFAGDALIDWGKGVVSAPAGTTPPLPATTITWSDTASGFENPVAVSDVYGLSLDIWRNSINTTYTDDYNGDGRSDLLLVYKPGNNSYTRAYLALAKSSGGFNNAVDITSQPGAPSNFWARSSIQATGDFNGDGRTDLLVRYHDISTSVYRVLGTSTGFAAPVDITTAYGTVSTEWEGKIDPGDFNGDGKTDLLLRFNDPHSAFPYTDAYLLTSNAAGTMTKADITMAYGMNTSTYGNNVNMWGGSALNMGDFNGDGKTDILVRYAYSSTCPATCYVLLLQARSDTTAGFNNLVNLSGKSGLPSDHWFDAELVPGDFNGDGRTDFLIDRWIGNSKPFYLVLAHGSDGKSVGGNIAFDTAIDISTSTTYGMTYALWNNATLVPGDFNGDGRTDLLVKSFVTNTPETADPDYLLFSNGGGFRNAINVTNLYGMTATSWGKADYRVGDYDGDGDDDLLVHAYDYASLPDTILKGAGNLPNVITKLDNGYGGSTTVGYTPSTTWINSNNPPREQTVSALTVSDGITAPTTTNYSYQGGMWDPAERRHLGFRLVKATDPTGAVQETYFYQGVGYPLGEVEFFNQRKAGGTDATNLMAQTHRELALSGGGTTPWVSSLTKQDEVEFSDGDTAYSQSQKTFAYDGYGNVTSMTEMGDVAIGGDERTTGYVYASPNSGAYMVSFPAVVSVYQGASTAGTIIKQTRNYYDNGALAAAPSKGDVTRTENWLNTNDAYLASTATYDGFGNQLSSTDPLGHSTTTVWGSWGLFPASTTNALGQTATAEWDAVCGTQTKSTDANGQSTIWSYDKLCRRYQESRPDGSYTTYSYANFGTPSSQYVRETVNNSLWHSSYFDGLGREWQAVNSGNNAIETVQTTYNSVGLVASVSAPYLASESQKLTRYTYDALKRLTSTTFADNSTRQMLYGNWMATTCDELGVPRTSYRDAYGQVRQVREYKSNGVAIGCSLAPACSLGTTCWDTQIGYDLLGQQLMVTDAVGNISTNTYDSLGRRTAMTDVDLGSWTYRYDDDGSLISQTDAKSQVTDFWYDALHRMVSKTYTYVVVCPKGHICPTLSTITLASYNYDEPGHGFGIGRRTSMLASGASTSFTYDAMGRVTSEQASIGASAYTIGRAYDTFGRVKTITYPDGEVLPYTYDAAGRMATAGGYVSSATYDARGNPKARVLGNRVQQNWTYDANRFWLANVNANLDATQFMSIDLGHNARGEIKTRRNGSQNDNWDYTYDDLRRLTIATNTSNGAWTQGFSYDALGRMTSQTGYGASAYTYPALGTGPQHAPATIGGLAASYDFNGNLLTGAGNSISYDRLNRPAMVNAVAMSYDADGARTMEGNSVFVSNLFEADTSASPATTTNYIFFNGQLVARKRAGAVSYYHGDSLGSVAMMTNSSGAVVLRKTYAPFGKVLLATGTLTDAFGLAGQRLDPTGLYHMGAREMAPGLGIFITPDPSDAPNAEHPQTLNRYVYADNSPTNLFDPTGYAAEARREDGAWSGFLNMLGQKFQSFSLFWHGMFDPDAAERNWQEREQLRAEAASHSGSLSYQMGGMAASTATTMATAVVNPEMAEADLPAMSPVSIASPVAKIEPPAIPAFVYRGGPKNPGAFKPRDVDQGMLSVRDSLSNPWPLPPGQNPPLPAGKPIQVIDTSRLPKGTVVPDGAPHGPMPAGHVSIGPDVPPDVVKDAVVETIPADKTR